MSLYNKTPRETLLDTSDTIMTHANTPSFPPLNKWQKAKAMAHIRKCETRDESFCNMENRIRECLRCDFHGKLRREFEGFIIYEVILRNYNATHPARNVKEAYQARQRLVSNRMDCRRKCGANPKYHARILCNQINQIMIDEKFFQFWAFRLRKPTGVQLSKSDEAWIKSDYAYVANVFYRDAPPEDTYTEEEERIIYEGFAQTWERVGVTDDFNKQRMLAGGIQDLDEYCRHIGREDLIIKKVPISPYTDEERFARMWEHFDATTDFKKQRKLGGGVLDFDEYCCQIGKEHLVKKKKATY